MRIEEPAGHFEREGFVEMVPPLRLPLRTAKNRVEVWLKVPEGGLIVLRADVTVPRLELPPGTVAARVELLASGGVNGEGFFAADVRGTRFAADGEHFFVLRPTQRELPSPLRGWSWRRGIRTEQRLADDRLATLVGSTALASERDEQMSGIRTSNACSRCHAHSRNENQQLGQYGVANRGTDASGCFQIQSVLQSELPLETYFPLETNAGDPFVTVTCGKERATFTDGRPTCPSGTVPRGRLAVRDGMLAADEHVVGVCRARRFLYDHLDAGGRSAFGEAFAECGIGQPK